jgi:lactate dehydrogenase-like 2-hydroxyacid dehydrogenase
MLLRVTAPAADGMPWPPPLEQITLEGGTALVLGIRGRIGMRVALGCAALGMKVIGTSSASAAPDTVNLTPGAEFRATVYPAALLHTLLPQARAVIVCVPSTPATRSIIGRPEIDLMPRNCLLVNVGRGVCVDGTAVYEALSPGYGAGSDHQQHHLFAYASDVWWQYPVSYEDAQNCPPRTLDKRYNFAEGPPAARTVLSCHRGGAVNLKDTELRRWRCLTGGFNHVAATGALDSLAETQGGLIGSVDLARGY